MDGAVLRRRATVDRRRPHGRRPRSAPASGSAARRLRRTRLASRHLDKDYYWIAAELALGLPHGPARVARWWRTRLQYRVASAEWTLKQLRALEALVLGHEPETDAWLRRQLAALGPKASP